MTDPSTKLIAELIELARLLGATQAKRVFGVYTQEDAMIERAFRQSIDEKAKTLCAEPARSIGKFKIGDHVRKIKGSQWKGRIVGWYSTALTPVGWAVESDTEVGSVQIYPESALELWGKQLVK